MGSLFARLACAVALFALGTTGCAAETAAADDESAEAAATRGAAASDPNATPATRTVLANLRSFDPDSPDPFDHRILVGQQEADVSNRATNGLAVVPSDMERVAGRPAGIVSYELSHLYKTSLTAFDAAGFRAGRPALRSLVLDKHAKGELVSLVWHLRCPKTAPTQADKFSPRDCPSDYRLEELLEKKDDGSRGKHFAEWRAMLDELAELLWSLKDDSGELVPVQIRPFHEHTGNWFWWGRDNDPKVYAAVWREMVTYLREGRGLHGVLWVYCPAAPSDRATSGLEAFYPGDAYVDVVGFDRYDLGDGGFARGWEADLRKVSAFARAHGKVAAVSEVGVDLARQAASVDPRWFSRTMLAPLKARGRAFAYVSLWRNAPWEKFVPEPGDGAIADDFASLGDDDGVLFGGVHDLYRPLHVGPSS